MVMCSVFANTECLCLKIIRYFNVKVRRQGQGVLNYLREIFSKSWGWLNTFQFPFRGFSFVFSYCVVPHWVTLSTTLSCGVGPTHPSSNFISVYIMPLVGVGFVVVLVVVVVSFGLFTFCCCFFTLQIPTASGLSPAITTVPGPRRAPLAPQTRAQFTQPEFAPLPSLPARATVSPGVAARFALFS